MSSLYDNLSNDDLKLEKEPLKNFPPLSKMSSAGSGLHIAVIGAFLISITSLVGSVYLYQSFNKEKRQREALEAAQVQIREKATAFEQEALKNKEEMTRLSEQAKTYSNLRQEVAAQLAESRKEVTDLRFKLQEVEARGLAMQKAAEEIQSNFDSKPVGPELGTEAVDTDFLAVGTSPQKAAVKTEKKPADITAEPAVIQEPQILSVNKKFNFVVVNVGSKNEIGMGDTLNIERKGKVVGTATVEKLYDNFAAATVVEQPKDAPFAVGDTVRKV